MRLWHYELIKVLPEAQIRGQWRECCCIAKSIKEKGTPNHILVNKVMNYDIKHFEHYAFLVVQEMKKRGHKINESCFTKYYPLINKIEFKTLNENLFDGWHNGKYFIQCYYNLQEKYDCGGISQEEWDEIVRLICFYNIKNEPIPKIQHLKIGNNHNE